MLSKINIKFIKSLRLKKYREINKKFIVEGDKITRELIHSNIETEIIFALQTWAKKNINPKIANKIRIINEAELKKISALKTPNQVLAIAKIPENYTDNNLENALCLVLEDIQDPGNFGTIIRTADWFGIKSIFCSENTVDLFNEKVIQSSMGSVFRINIVYMDIIDLIEKNKNKIPVFGTFTTGDNIFNLNLPPKGLIVFGNE